MDIKDALRKIAVVPTFREYVKYWGYVDVVVNVLKEIDDRVINEKEPYINNEKCFSPGNFTNQRYIFENGPLILSLEKYDFNNNEDVDRALQRLLKGLSHHNNWDDKLE